jgi:hypothetical protein
VAFLVGVATPENKDALDAGTASRATPENKDALDAGTASLFSGVHALELLIHRFAGD